jgi:large subunit ribosomal protein L15
MPLARRVPKRGFHSPFKTAYQVVNVDTLQKIAADGKLQNGMVTPEVLVKLGILSKTHAPLKVLGNGELSTKLEVSAHAFSQSAVQKIEAAGGKVQTISSTPKE